MKVYAKALRAFAAISTACLICFYTSVDQNNKTWILESEEPVGRMNRWEAWASQRARRHAVSPDAQIEVSCVFHTKILFYFVIGNCFVPESKTEKPFRFSCCNAHTLTITHAHMHAYTWTKAMRNTLPWKLAESQEKCKHAQLHMHAYIHA